MTFSIYDTQHNKSADCRDLLIVMLNVVMLSVVMLNVVALSPRQHFHLERFNLTNLFWWYLALGGLEC